MCNSMIRATERSDSIIHVIHKFYYVNNSVDSTDAVFLFLSFALLSGEFTIRRNTQHRQLVRFIVCEHDEANNNIQKNYVQTDYIALHYLDCELFFFSTRSLFIIIIMILFASGAGNV